jgi:hypothetical protein
MMMSNFEKIGEFDSSDPADPFGDQATLRKLADAGSDLTQETSFLHTLSFSDESSMIAAGRAIRESLGYGVQGSASDRSPEHYTLHVRIERIPTPDNVIRMRQIMTVAAERFAGEYDGWEAAVRRIKRDGPA